MAKLFTESTDHKMLNGTELIKRREALGLTQAEFAGKCGWSRTTQWKLEKIGIHEVPSQTAERIKESLKKNRNVNRLVN